jgi:hypothetical protein
MPNIDYGSPVVSGNVEVSATIDETKRTVSHAFAFRTSAGTSTLGTVPANKVWRIIGFNLTTQVETGNVDTRVDFKLAGNEAFSVRAWSANTYGTGGVADSIVFDYFTCPVIEAGEAVTLVCNVAVQCAGNVYYIEEDA